ncbi:hypothetical protein G6F68_013490 [Rhizopus microsporus]|nr:hypothetical protein G6F68_013490 [Rhizopus microsporus]
MAAENALSDSSVPTNTEAVAIGAIITPAMAASAELMTNTATATALALMPIRLAVDLLNATARTALPILVLCSAQSNTIIRTSVVQNTRISWGRTPVPKIVMMPSPSGDATAIGAGPQISSARFWMMMPKPMHESQQPQDQHGRQQREQERSPGHVLGAGKADQLALRDQQDRADADQAGQGQERALAEVERLGRGVGDAETERDQGIDAAHGQSTQYGL